MDISKNIVVDVYTQVCYRNMFGVYMQVNPPANNTFIGIQLKILMG